MVLKKSAIIAHRLLWLSLFVLLMLVASYVSIGRYYISYVEQYQDQLVARFVELSGLPLAVDRVHGRWEKLSPHLSFEGIKLNGRSETVQPVLLLPKATLQLNPLLSLLSGELRIDQLESDGVRISLDEIEPGRWQLTGYGFESSGPTDLDALLDSLLSVEVIKITDSHLSLQYFSGAKANLTLHELMLRRDGNYRRIRLSAAFKQNAEPLNIVIEARGDPRKLDSFSARAHIDFNDIDFVDQLPLLESRGLFLQQAVIDSEVWVDWQPGTAITVQGWASAPVFDAGIVSGKSLPAIEDFHASFRLEKNRQHDWQLWVPKLKAAWKGHPFSFEQLYLEREKEKRFLMMPVLKLDSFTADILALDILEGRALSALTQLSPQGSLENIKVQLPYTRSGNQVSLTDHFNFSAELKDVSVDAWQGAPAVTGVNGFIDLDAHQGRVELSSDAFSMYFPDIYQLPMMFSSAKGIVGWQLDQGRVTVVSGPLELEAEEHGAAMGVFSLDFPGRDSADHQSMFLSVGLRDVAAKYRNKFIPFIVDERLRGWLDQSVLAGNIPRGSFIYNGSLRKEGAALRTVQLSLDVEEGELKFSDDWPRLTDLQARVLVDDSFVDVQSPSAKMFDLQASNIEVRSQLLSEVHSVNSLTGSWLTVDADIHGPSASGLKVVTHSVLRDWVGSSFDHWRLEGEVTGNLNLGLALSNSQYKPEINFTSQLSDSALYIEDFSLVFSNVNGALNYHSDKGLYSSGIGADFFGFKQSLQLSQSDQGVVVLDMEGQISAQAVGEWTKQPALVFLDGVTQAKTQLFIQAEKSYLDIQSDLVGVSIDLPAPFGKAKQQESSLSVHLPVGRKDPLLEIDYADLLGLKLQLQGYQFERGLLWVGDPVAPMPKPNTLLVVGELEALELEGFESILARYTTEQQRLSRDAPVSAEDAVKLVVRNLHVEQLDAYGMTLENNLLDVERVQEGWQVSIVNQLVDGAILFPDDDGVPHLQLQRLHLSTGLGDGLPTIDPRKLMDLEVTLGQLYLDAEALGAVHFVMRSDERALQVSDIYGGIRGVRLGSPAQPVSMVWLRGDYGDTTSIAGEVYFDNIQDVVNRWGGSSMLTSKEGRVDVAMSWPAAPMDWQLAEATGRLGLTMMNGEFMSGSDAAEGAMKLVGVFNLTNILRRLRFDFSDVYKSGISYDDISGQFEVDGGVMTISDTLTIKTPSSLFRIHGDTSLVDEQLDMNLIATLPVANNLPWIAALAGGLPAAAGVYVASKIFEDQVQKLSSAVYSISGSWSEPKVKFVKVFGDKDKK